MTHTVFCTVLNKQAEGLEKPPWPGELGQRIFENVSAEGWRQWLERQVMLINEYRLSSADEQNLELLEQHMLGFLFGEGEMGQAPDGYMQR